MSNEMSSWFDVKLAVKRVAYFQTVCPDFIIVLYFLYFSLFRGNKSHLNEPVKINRQESENKICISNEFFMVFPSPLWLG
jgi:hypothetical protein